MIPVKHIDPEDLPLYAMQFLAPDEMEELGLHLQHSVEARRVLSEIYGDLSVLALSAEMHTPPAIARQRLLKHVAREKKTAPVGLLDRFASTPDAYTPRASAASLLEEEPVSSTFIQKAAPWTGWLLAAAVSAFTIFLYQQNNDLKTTVTSVRRDDARTQSAAAVASVLFETMKDPNAVHATLTSVEARPQPSGRVTYVAEKGSLVFVASNLQPLQPEKIY